MKVLKLKLFQETACYKMPFALKVFETYPLPPYSTLIGMFHKILESKSGEYFPMNISVQGEYENIFNNYQTLRIYKKDMISKCPRNINLLFNMSLIIHVEAKDSILDKIYNNIFNKSNTLTLGRNEDIVRLDDIKYVSYKEKTGDIKLKHNIYIPTKERVCENVYGNKYRLNTVYNIDKRNLRQWKKVEVKYIEMSKNLQGTVYIDNEEDMVCMFDK